MRKSNSVKFILVSEMAGLKRAREKLIEKGRDKEMTSEELELAEQSLAYSCIKYSDLAHNRNHEYVFSYDKVIMFVSALFPWKLYLTAMFPWKLYLTALFPWKLYLTT